MVAGKTVAPRARRALLARIRGRRRGRDARREAPWMNDGAPDEGRSGASGRGRPSSAREAEEPDRARRRSPRVRTETRG